MLHFFTKMSLTTAVILGMLLAGSLFIRNLWCRYFCPYGALMGIFAMASPTRIYRNPDTCIGCDRCTRACPSDLPVSRKTRIDSLECTGCLDCTMVCPVEQTLQFQSVGRKKSAWKTAALGMTIVLIFAGMVFAARITGHWESIISVHEFSMRLKMIDSPEVAHPKTQF